MVCSPVHDGFVAQASGVDDNACTKVAVRVFCEPLAYCAVFGSCVLETSYAHLWASVGKGVLALVTNACYPNANCWVAWGGRSALDAVRAVLPEGRRGACGLCGLVQRGRSSSVWRRGRLRKLCCLWLVILVWA